MCGSGSPQLQCFTPAGTGEGHPEQNGAYANVPQLRPSARQNRASPGERVAALSGPVRNAAYLCQPCMTTSCVLD